jgi:hypothetical protein
MPRMEYTTVMIRSFSVFFPSFTHSELGSEGKTSPTLHRLRGFAALFARA